MAQRLTQFWGQLIAKTEVELYALRGTVVSAE
jgi:hypothetical protein